MNKPVAWLWVHKGTTMNALLRNPMCDEYGKKHFEPKGWSSIPLYTHPVEITDEEIISTMVQFDVYSSDDHCLIEVGRAILRKAQEK